MERTSAVAGPGPSGLSSVEPEELKGVAAATRPLRVLVVDDTLSVRQSLHLILNRRGHPHDIVTNGREAVEQCRREFYDAVLMDVQMPVMNGLEATSRIRSLPAGSSFVVIALTAYALRDIQSVCLNAGMDAYVSKPIVIKDLLRALEETVERCRSRRKGLDALGNRKVAKMGDASMKDPGAPTERPVLNLEAARRRLGNDEILLKELAKFFLEDAPTLFARLRTSALESDAELAARSAHSMKGISSNFDAVALVEVAQAIEDLAGRGELDAVQQRLGDLQFQMQRTLDALRRDVLS